MQPSIGNALAVTRLEHLSPLRRSINAESWPKANMPRPVCPHIHWLLPPLTQKGWLVKGRAGMGAGAAHVPAGAWQDRLSLSLMLVGVLMS